MSSFNNFLQILGISLLLQCVQNSAGAGDKTNDRMVNGEPAPKHMYPYIALLQVWHENVGWKTGCHGVITDPYTIITVNYCVSIFFPGGTRARAIAGVHKPEELENTRQTKAVCRANAFAPSDNHLEHKNMYAVIHLSEPFVFNMYVTSINLPVPGIDVRDTDYCVFAAWGRITGQTDRYQFPQHKYTTNGECEGDYTHESTLCTTKDTCSDEGAPIVCMTPMTNYFFVKGLAIKSGDGNCGGQSVFTNLPKMDYNWYKSKQEEAKADCRAREKIL